MTQALAQARKASEWLTNAANEMRAEDVNGWPVACDAGVEAINALLAAIDAGGASGWMTIDSAPKDGTLVLAVSNDAQRPRVHAAWWHDGWWRSYKPMLDKFETENPFRWFPTHWQPLPSPPIGA